MSKQRPDPAKLANELAGASAFFRRPAPPAPAHADQASPPPAAASADRSAEPPTVRTTAPQPTARLAAPEMQPDRPVRPVRRLMIRHAFELYADQLERLRALADLQKRQGETGSMSKMVRDAIDRLLDEQLP